MTTNKVVESRTHELIVLLDDLKKLHEELLSVIQQKLSSMRRADTESLNSCLARERFLADRIRQREGLRQQLVQLIAKELGISAEASKRLSLRGLSERLAEPHQDRLLGLAAAIRDLLARIDSGNKVAALVTSEMLKHYRSVYAAMAKAGQSAGTYSQRGQLKAGRPVQVFDAVG